MNCFGKAPRLTGIKEDTALVRLGIEALIAMESSKRLAKFGGTIADKAGVGAALAATLLSNLIAFMLLCALQSSL